MPAAQRTYWLTTPCRIRRQDQSLVIERDHEPPVHLPVTDIADFVATAPVDVNTAVVSLLSRHGIVVHLLDHYGNYAGQLSSADGASSGLLVARQIQHAATSLDVARALVNATAHNVAWVVGRDPLQRGIEALVAGTAVAETTAQLMAAEGNFRRTAWALLDTQLPAWLQLHGRSRRPPANAGNAFVSYVNGIMYARVLTAIRLTPLHAGIGFLHTSMVRQRYTLALDLAEPFKPLFAERLLLRAAHQGMLHEHDFDSDVASAVLSATGRKRVVQLVRDELTQTVYHRALKRAVRYEELLHLEALKLVHLCLENEPYRAFKVWW